jgi:hypothetical protein
MEVLIITLAAVRAACFATYLGHLRFEHLGRRFGLTINHKPMDLLKVWSVSGGLPLRQRAQNSRVHRYAVNCLG